ncbi:hypothetical protein FEO87_10575 [Stenotrophomonas maltophilia]|nr:hypothetical protein FEO87_10575 [Stenotrophomonas maltophilia]
MNLWSEATAVATISGAIGIVGAVIGGLISANAAVKAVDRQLAADRDRRDSDERAHLKSLGSAIKLELQTIREIHLAGVAAELAECRKSGTFFDSYYPIYSDYFTLFTGNSAAIGRAPPHVAQGIVKAYIELKALVDTFRFNNAMLDRVEDLVLRGVPETDERLIEIKDQLNEYGSKLVTSHDQAMRSVEDAITALEGL